MPLVTAERYGPAFKTLGGRGRVRSGEPDFAGEVIEKLLEQDAVAATAAGRQLSHWAATRLFDRLEGLGAVRELSAPRDVQALWVVTMSGSDSPNTRQSRRSTSEDEVLFDRELADLPPDLRWCE